MKTVLRPRYYCEYCKKSGGRKDIIAKHETGCTANPNRVCGCCRLAAMKQPSIDELRNALNEDAKEFGEYSPHDDGESVHLRNAPTLMALITPNDRLYCPACMLTVLRACNASLAGFDFKESMASWMNEFGTMRDDR